MAQLKHRTSNTRALFRGPEASLEQEYMAEDEQEEYIESLRISNERANNSFKFVLAAFSLLEIVAHLGFVAYGHCRKASMPGLAFPDHMDPSVAFRQNISPTAATLFSLLSFGAGISIIKDVSLIRRDVLAVWTAVSLVPLVLMAGTTEFSFELMWWSMPLLLQTVDLASLWIMKDPEEDFFQLERSQYKLKGA